MAVSGGVAVDGTQQIQVVNESQGLDAQLGTLEEFDRAITIDPGGRLSAYQGIVPLEGEPLVDAAHTYFRQSEQIPTFIRLAVARHYGPATGGRLPPGHAVHHVVTVPHVHRRHPALRDFTGLRNHREPRSGNHPAVFGRGPAPERCAARDALSYPAPGARRRRRSTP